MLTMAVVAVYLAIVKHQPNNIGGGIITFYLIGTAWLTARRREGETSRMDWVALLIPLALGILTWMNRSLHKCIQGKVDAKRRRCLLASALAFDLSFPQDEGPSATTCTGSALYVQVAEVGWRSGEFSITVPSMATGGVSYLWPR